MKKEIAQVFTVLSVLAFLSSAVWSQEIDLDNYVITHFGMEDGLPQSSINDIIQSRDGYIWLATYGGIVRFDGNTFTTFDRSNTEGMISDRAIRLYEDTKGGIWFFVESAEPIIMRLHKGLVKTYYFPNEKGFILTFEEDERGVLWASAYDKIYRFEKDNFTEILPLRNTELAKIAKKDNTGLWLISRSELFRTYNDKVVVIEENLDEKFGSSVMTMTEYPKDSGTYFYGTNSEGIFVDDNGSITSFDDTNGLPSNSVLRFQIQSDKLSATFVNSVAFWDGNKFVEFQPPSFPEGAQKRNFIKDNEGNYWVGSSGDGLYKLRPTFISMIDKKDGLRNDKMLSLEMLNDGTALFSTNCGGIHEWDGNRVSYSRLHTYFDGGCNWSVFQDSKHRIWIGSNDVYVTDSIDKKGKYLTLDEDNPGHLVFSITEDKKGNIWVGTSGGVFKYDEISFKKFTIEEGLYYNDSRVFYEDKNGVMWLGTNLGLNTIKDDIVSKVELLSSSDGTGNSIQPYVRAIHEDVEGIIWIGTYGNGLFRIKEGKINQVTTKEGLFDNIVSTINEDEFGNLWMGSNRGISQVSKKDLNSLIQGEIQQVYSYSYGISDGMNSAETNGGFQPSTIQDTNGNIYYPTVAGVAVVSTRDFFRNETLPPVYIESIRNSESEIPLSSSITIPYNTPYLEINYTAINFNEPKNVNFKYKMEGLNDEWIEVDNRRSAIYSKIPPGAYKFTVIASNSDGIWNNVGDSFEIIVPSPFWQTSWFYTLVFISLTMGGFSFYYSRTQRLKKENERQKRFTEQLIDSQEQERRRIASELHDGLGQQILVIKNRVQLAKLEATNNKGITDQLDEIMHSAESSIEDVRNISHNLRPVLLEKFGLTEAITNLCEELEQTSSIEWSYHVDDIDGYIPKNKEINLYRVLQEGTKNVLEHANAEQASLMIQRTKEIIKITIWDDGKGFRLNLISESDGLGFIGMEERVQTLSGKLEIDSIIGEGTTLRIELPIEKNA